MSSDYVNFSQTAFDPMLNHVSKNWVDSPQASFCDKQFVARGAYLGLAPLSFVAHVIDTVIGVVSGTAAI